jgi:hypothetical protein
LRPYVELPAELGQQQGEVAPVLRPDHVAGLAFRGGPLPVQVDAVEDAGRRAGAALDRAELRQVALDEQVDAGGDERLAGGAGQRRVGEERRPGPAADRQQHLEVWVPRLELAELVEVALERLVGLSATPSTLSAALAGRW